jgi:hypothetical protein
MKIIYPFGREMRKEELNYYGRRTVRCKCGSAVLFATGQNNLDNNYCACSDDNGRMGSRVNAG